MGKSLENVRRDMPCLKDLVYLDSASVVPAPVPVIQAMEEYLHDYPFNYGVGVWRRSAQAAARVDDARRIAAQAVGAASDTEIAFTKNTTEAINLVAVGLGWKPGDEIVLTDLEHQSNAIPWMRAAQENGGRVRFVPADPDGMVDPADVRKAMTSSTRLVACTHVSNVFGTIQPVQEITRIAHDHGALAFVDAAQSAGRIPVHVGEIGCDFAAFCGRKALMGPQGTGFLWGRLELLQHLAPLTTGSRAANLADAESFRPNQPPHKFEAGVLNTLGVIGLGRAIQYVEAIGYDAIRAHIRDLTAYMIETLRATPRVNFHGSSRLDRQAGIVMWSVQGMNPDQVARELDRIGKVAVASGAQGSLLAIKPKGVTSIVRTSVHCCNTREDIDALAAALRKMVARQGH
ncbi:MAG TPA: cysteine desulfurase [Candidatus Methylomirabilis sp.]|nr:cysteine desulfurase [Candidatus Methylomirabilis sp.]HSC70457.1 cysteine desulfurase [Candidatus Methylomirabilis sp.]